MAKAEHPEKYNWWLNELDSLGISTLQKNGIDNRHKEQKTANKEQDNSHYGIILV
jgi:hypothetical protein